MVQIKLEQIGDYQKSIMELGYRELSAALGQGIADAVIGKPKNRAWCAEIIGFDTKWGLSRRFLRGNRSYVEANGVGSRGVYDYYNLQEGSVYEVVSPQSWNRSDRYFCRVVKDDIIRMSKEEVEQWLRTRLG